LAFKMKFALTFSTYLTRLLLFNMPSKHTGKGGGNGHDRDYVRSSKGHIDMLTMEGSI